MPCNKCHATDGAEGYGGERKRRKGYAEGAKGNTKIWFGGKACKGCKGWKALKGQKG